MLNHQDKTDEKALSHLIDYIQHEPSSSNSSRLRVALVTSGVDEADYQNIVQNLHEKLQEDSQAVNGNGSQNLITPSTRDVLVELKAQQCTNLQVALKNLVKLVITQASDVETYQQFLVERKKLLPLNYDLDFLDQFYQKNTNLRVIVSLSDIESFSNNVINELIPTLNILKDRVKLVLILAIASTRELFEQRLSRSCLKLLDAKQFQFAPSTNLHSRLIRQVQKDSDSKSCLNFDSTTLLALNDVCQKQGNSTQSVEQMLRLIYMSHNLANPLSDLSRIAELPDNETHLVAEAARRTDSFKQYCTGLLRHKTKQNNQKIRMLLEDDSKLLKEIKEQVEHGRQLYTRSLEAIHFLTDLHEALNAGKPKSRQSRTEIDSLLLRSLSNLVDCDIYVEICDKLQSLSSPQILTALEQISREVSTTPDYRCCIESAGERPEPTNNTGVAKGPKHRGKRPQAETQSKALTSSPAAAVLVTTEERVLDKEAFLEFLEKLVNENTINVSEILLHESFIIPNRSLRLKQYFEPNPRVAVERALTSPGDYLGCACCGASSAEANDEGDVIPNGGQRNGTGTGSMPPASILFVLLQEAPTIINLRDLYDAFESRLQESHAVSQQDDEGTSTTLMMLFYRALAELKMLGFVKESAGTQVKRKAKASKAAAQEADFVAKTSWAGL